MLPLWEYWAHRPLLSSSSTDILRGEISFKPYQALNQNCESLLGFVPVSSSVFYNASFCLINKEVINVGKSIFVSILYNLCCSGGNFSPCSMWIIRQNRALFHAALIFIFFNTLKFTEAATTDTFPEKNTVDVEREDRAIFLRRFGQLHPQTKQSNYTSQQIEDFEGRQQNLINLLNPFRQFINPAHTIFNPTATLNAGKNFPLKTWESL